MAYDDDRPGFFGYLFRLVLVLLVLGAIGLLAFAYFGDLSVEPAPRSLPIDLDAS